jgi:hypothetical protein
VQLIWVWIYHKRYSNGDVDFDGLII